MPVFSFKVDSQSAERIRAKARSEKSSLSAFLRKAALGADPSKSAKIVHRKHSVSGLPFNAAGVALRVTDEEIRASLADFP